MSDLAEQIDALLAINATGKVSHPVPGLAVELLTKAAEALRAVPAPVPVTITQEVARAALNDWDRNTCIHENTHRGGVIWTICDDCGCQWADDRGGFVPYSDPPGIAALRAALSQKPGEQGK